MTGEQQFLGKAFRYTDLPHDVQQKLLTLQNGNGDYYKFIIEYKIFGGILSIIILFVVMLFFGGLYRTFYDEGYRALWFTVEFILFVWLVYGCFRVFRKSSAQIKQAIYVTPTQHIQVLEQSHNPRIFCNDLKDFTKTTEIKPIFYYRKVGNSRYKTIKGYNLFITDKHGSRHRTEFKAETEAEHWRVIFCNWIDYANQAFHQGNSAYFDSWDIFRGAKPLSIAECKLSRTNLLLTLALIAFSLFLTIPVFLFNYSFGESTQSKRQWENVKSANTATEYISYLNYPGKKSKHFEEAKKACLGLYDEAISTTKANQTLTKMLENSRLSLEKNVSPNSAENGVYLNLEYLNGKNLGLNDKYLLINGITKKFKENFPNEVLKVYFREDLSFDDIDFKKNRSIIKIQISDVKNIVGKSKITEKQKKYEITCEVKVADQSVDNFTEKAVIFDEFLGSFSKRAGFEK